MKYFFQQIFSFRLSVILFHLQRNTYKNNADINLPIYYTKSFKIKKITTIKPVNY